MTNEEYAVTCYKDGKIALEVRTTRTTEARLLAETYAKSGEYDVVKKRGPYYTLVYTRDGKKNIELEGTKR